MKSRRYIKRPWRVPVDRGALEYLAALVVKLMVKHGWPVKYRLEPVTQGFVVYEQGQEEGELPDDLQEAFEIACRIIARTYRLEITQYANWCGLDREYTVTQGREFRKK